jgi:fucose 4-O-acetylase-like acetyltransferase
MAVVSALTGALSFGYIYPVFAFFVLHAAFYGLRLSHVADKLVLALNAIGKQSLLIYILHTVALYAVLHSLPLGLGGAAQYVIYVAAALALSYAGAVAFMAAYSRAISGMR